MFLSIYIFINVLLFIYLVFFFLAFLHKIKRTKKESTSSSFKCFFFTLLAPVLDDSTVCHLCEMGFPLEACRRAVYYTGNTGIDAATNWIMSHIDDPGETGKPLLTVTGK